VLAPFSVTTPSCPVGLSDWAQIRGTKMLLAATEDSTTVAVAQQKSATLRTALVGITLLAHLGDTSFSPERIDITIGKA